MLKNICEIVIVSGQYRYLKQIMYSFILPSVLLNHHICVLESHCSKQNCEMKARDCMEIVVQEQHINKSFLIGQYRGT